MGDMCKYDPFFSHASKDIDQLKKEILNDHREIFSRLITDIRQIRDGSFKVITDNDKKFEVIVNTRGFKPEELNVKVKDNIVTIEAKRQVNKEGSKSQTFMSRKFRRSYTLPSNCQMENVTSKLTTVDNILLVTAPKTKSDGSRKIPIEITK